MRPAGSLAGLTQSCCELRVWGQGAVVGCYIGRGWLVGEDELLCEAEFVGRECLPWKKMLPCYGSLFLVVGECALVGVILG